MAVDRTRVLRGAVAGAAAAGVWAAQMPLDKRVFASNFDDVELLGKAFTRGRAWPAVGLVLHIQNGALFGGAYAALAPRLPLPSWSRGPLAAMVALADRLHPARDEMPRAFGNTRALAQATWRHLVFGVALGEIERRLNAEPAAQLPRFDDAASTNGHGSLEHAATLG
jgi:hypothetical protein